MNPQFCKAFSAYPVSPLSVIEFTKGPLVHPRAEVLAAWAVLKPVGKSSAAAFAIADSDIDKIVSTFIAQDRWMVNGMANAWMNDPSINRDVSMYAMGEDVAQIGANIRNAASINAVGGAAQTFNIPIPLPALNIQKEFPNLNAFSAGQLQNNSRCDLDLVASPPALPATIVLTNGSLVVSALTAELWVLRGSVRPLLWMAPYSQLFVRNSTSQTVEAEAGPLFDELVMATAATLSNAGGVVKVTIDGKEYVEQTASTNLQLGASAVTKANIAGVPGYDVWQNTKDSQASRTGRVPLVYLPGLQHPTEGEYPVVNSQRAINFGPGQTAAQQMAFWRQSLISDDKNQKQFASMLNDPSLMQYAKDGGLSVAEVAALKSLSQQEFSIYGGARNSNWKAMEFAKREGA